MILYLQSTHIQPLSCLHFLACLKIETEQKSNNDLWWCGNTQFQVVFWKMNAILIHAHLRKDFVLSPKANYWRLSGKSLWRSNHFPWGCFFVSGLGMGWWSFSSRWAFCLTAVHRWLTSWLLIMEGCCVLGPGWSAGWKLLMHSQ